MIRNPFVDGWSVRKDGTDEAVEPVTLPYDAMFFERRDPGCRNAQNTGYYPGGTYRYAKTFVAPGSWSGHRVLLEFEAVYHRSEVLLNGVRLGGRPSGYATFRVDLTDDLRLGEDNLVEVVAHNADEPNSRWYTGSGIYRPVHLLVGGPVRIAPDGLRIATTTLTTGEATVEVAVHLVNDRDEPTTARLDVALIDDGGDAVRDVIDDVVVPAHGDQWYRQRLTLLRPRPWSEHEPVLYNLSVSVAVAGRHVDQATERVGIRTVEVDATRGLRVNGEPVKLRGACIHHDNGIIGAHEFDAAADRRIRILKEAGYNAVRSAHNPVSQALLRACDRHGMYVMDELTDVWYRPKHVHDYSLDFPGWWERDLEAMVEKDRNHPSVILYSIGNEIAETARPRGIALNRRIADRCRELDPGRPVTNGVNGFFNLVSPSDEKRAAADRRARATGTNPAKNLITVLNVAMTLLDRAMPWLMRLPAVDRRTRHAFAALDVAGYNYGQTRYARDAAAHPGRVIVGSETTSAQVVRYWRDIERMPHVIGDFVWTGWDFLGEAGIAATRYDEPRRLISPYPALLAGEPVIDITGRRQTQSYVNEIVWRRRVRPHVAVRPVDRTGQRTPHNGWRCTDSVASWAWEGHEGRTAVVEVYADAPRVELLINGRRVGTGRATARTGYLATFEIPYTPGELTAVAYDDRDREIGRDTLRSAGAGLQVRVTPEDSVLTADGSDLAYVRVELTDEAGVLRPLADREVRMTLEGPGTLLGFGSADPVTTDEFARGRAKTYHGSALAVVRSGHEAGELALTAVADGCEPVTALLHAVAADTAGDRDPARYRASGSPET